MYHLKKMSCFLPWRQDPLYCPMFQLYKAAWICHHHSFHDGITTTSYTQRAFHLRRSSLRSQQGAVTSRLPQWRKIEMSVGFHLAHNYQPLVEFGGTRILPLVLPADYVNIVVEILPGLVEAMCRNEHFVWRSEDKVFRMHRTGSYNIARFTHDKHWISLKLHERRTLQYIFHTIMNTLCTLRYWTMFKLM